MVCCSCVLVACVMESEESPSERRRLSCRDICLPGRAFTQPAFATDCRRIIAQFVRHDVLSSVCGRAFVFTSCSQVNTHSSAEHNAFCFRFQRMSVDLPETGAFYIYFNMNTPNLCYPHKDADELLRYASVRQHYRAVSPPICLIFV